MGLIRTRKSRKVKIRSEAWPLESLIDTIKAIEIDGVPPNIACRQLMERHPEVLASEKVTLADYNGKWGQISGSLGKYLSGLVDRDDEAYEKARAAGLNVYRPSAMIRSGPTLAKAPEPVDLEEIA